MRVREDTQPHCTRGNAVSAARAETPAVRVRRTPRRMPDSDLPAHLQLLRACWQDLVHLAEPAPDGGQPQPRQPHPPAAAGAARKAHRGARSAAGQVRRAARRRADAGTPEYPTDAETPDTPTSVPGEPAGSRSTPGVAQTPATHKVADHRACKRPAERAPDRAAGHLGPSSSAQRRRRGDSPPPPRRPRGDYSPRNAPRGNAPAQGRPRRGEQLPSRPDRPAFEDRLARTLKAGLASVHRGESTVSTNHNWGHDLRECKRLARDAKSTLGRHPKN